MCESDEYLYEEVERLDKETNPYSRKRFAPAPIDSVRSFGMVQEGDNYCMSDDTEKNIHVEFFNTDMIDEIQSTAYIREGHVTLKPFLEQTSTIVKSGNHSPLE